jgi:hypothetical protein
MAASVRGYFCAKCNFPSRLFWALRSKFRDLCAFMPSILIYPKNFYFICSTAVDWAAQAIFATFHRDATITHGFLRRV